MKDFIYNTPTKIYFGANKEEELGNILKENKVNKLLLHYGKSSIKKSGLYDKIVNILNINNINFIELGGVEANPKLLAWLFDDNSLIGKSYLALNGERYEAFQDFYDSLDIYG